MIIFLCFFKSNKFGHNHQTSFFITITYIDIFSVKANYKESAGLNV